MKPGLQISAGEIEKYAYCPLNWWLYREGISARGRGQAEGTEKHRDLAEDLTLILRKEERAGQWETLVVYFALASSLVAILGLTLLQRFDASFASILSVVALIWLLAATYLIYRAERVALPEDKLISERLLVVFAMVATIIALFSISLSFLEDRIVASVLEVVALLWLIGASFFLYRSMRDLMEARDFRFAKNIGENPIAYVDDPGQSSELLASKAHGLAGRPDFILQEEDGLIPVEVKTGRKPRGPLFSHILQVTAYCFLIEETSGRKPPYGLLRYGDTVHEIEYTDDLRNLLLSKLDEMRAVANGGEAHRNHHRPGKCANCSRRYACPERLA
ncbi:MAG: CRISPR-associated protein Cas4 [Candidatus Thermoplasmatota archaeon]|nr:CRISPR-associated protein Cas4 [Candidatus Thermoplasmatota archaeon]